MLCVIRQGVCELSWQWQDVRSGGSIGYKEKPKGSQVRVGEGEEVKSANVDAREKVSLKEGG